MSGKKYRDKSKLIDKVKAYSINEAVKLVKQIAYAKFDETVSVSVNLGIDTKKTDQLIRGTVSLPHGLGKKVNVAVITKGEKTKEAEEAGADVVGSDELIQKIQSGWLEFDVLITSPDMMGQVGKLGKILGGKGLMPSPKSGTVTQDIGKTVKEFKKGKVEYRTDKFGNVQAPIGKISFDEEKLRDNLKILLETIQKARPAALKGIFIKNIVIAPTMGPGIKVEIPSL
jgi:large subunit ribosomal protein L1